MPKKTSAPTLNIDIQIERWPIDRLAPREGLFKEDKDLAAAYRRLLRAGFRTGEIVKVLTRRPVTASEDEVKRNPRSRSAKLRVAEKR